MEKNEINKAIATKLFGKELWLCKTSPNNTGKFIKADFCGIVADAYKVVEEMEKRGFVWTFSNNGNEVAAKYDARFFILNKKWGAPDFIGIAIKETLPEAICCAALKAIENL